MQELHHKLHLEMHYKTRAQETAVEGIGAFQPFLDRAQTQADLASGLGTLALGQVAGVPTGATAISTR